MADTFLMDSHKLFWHLDRVHDWLQGKRIAPLYIDMGITQTCNVQCSYCYYAVPEHRTNAIIETPALISFLKEAAEIGVKAVGFLGDGEPMIHPGVYDAVAAGKGAGLDMALSTNGVLMKEERLQELLSSLTWIRFNISAATPSTYASVMGVDENVFYKVVENIRRCVRIKRVGNLPVVIGIQMVLIPGCFEDLVPFAAMGRDLGVDYAVVKQCAERTDTGQAPSTEDLERHKHLLEQAESLSNDSYNVIIKWRKISNDGVKNYDRCYGCEFLPQISGNGDVYSCGAWFGNPDFLIGNINHETFKEIVAGRRYAEVMRRVKNEVNVHNDCGTNCRQNEINEFLWKLKNPPEHVNFI